MILESGSVFFQQKSVEKTPFPERTSKKNKVLSGNSPDDERNITIEKCVDFSNDFGPFPVASIEKRPKVTGKYTKIGE